MQFIRCFHTQRHKFGRDFHYDTRSFESFPISTFFYYFDLPFELTYQILEDMPQTNPIGWHAKNKDIGKRTHKKQDI